jgi:FkbM family methyltransferase
MIKMNKFTSFKRLNSSNVRIVVIYLIKIILQIKPTREERDIYILYDVLIAVDGSVVEETKNSFILDFKTFFTKRVKIRKRPSSDMDVFRQINVFKEYLPVVKTYQEHFFNDKEYVLNIIDAGSNIGLTSLFFLDFFKNAKIICIEPDSENFKTLAFNLNNNYSIIKINGAIWSSNTKIKVVNDFRDKLDWSCRVEETVETSGIQAYSINHLIEANKMQLIDILKIDIEGSEKEIFNLKTSNLDFLKITKCLAIEIHDEFNCRVAIYTILNNYGFSYFEEGELTICINEFLK